MAIELDHLSDRELLVLVVNQVNGINDRLDKLNGRVRILEDWRNYILGGMALLSMSILIGVPVALKLLIK